MEIFFNWRYLLVISIGFFVVVVAPNSLAKSLNLYDQPNSHSKIVAITDTTAGLIPIFSSQNSDWVKVGDPRNGNVGWIKTTDLDNPNVNTSTSDKSKPNYPTIQFGSLGPSYTSAQLQQTVQLILGQQQTLQQNMQQMAQDLGNTNQESTINGPKLVTPSNGSKPRAAHSKHTVRAKKKKKQYCSP